MSRGNFKVEYLALVKVTMFHFKSDPYNQMIYWRNRHKYGVQNETLVHHVFSFKSH